MTTTQTASSAVGIDNVSISYGTFTAVHETTLNIDSGEFFTLLGPSGCGKTTLLRTIAGFNQQTNGIITLGDDVIDNLPPYKRDTGMVFQNYAVFPHLNVEENVAYGLKSRGIKGEAARRRVAECLEMVDLGGQAKKLPREMSGGQQQRVVIARAIAIRPRVLLMDEPLANLDAKLRVKLRNDIKRLQRELNITTVYVTHDQEEALSISDRIAVMSEGNVLQVDAPQRIYRSPSTLKVARFIGEGAFLPANVVGRNSDGGPTQVALNQSITMPVQPRSQLTEDRLWYGVRPEAVQVRSLKEAAVAGGQIDGVIEEVIFLGGRTRFVVDCGLEVPIPAEVPSNDTDTDLQVGSRVGLSIREEDSMLFSMEQDAEVQP